MNFYHRHRDSIIQYIKYCIVGLFCAALDIGVLNGLLHFFPTENKLLLTLFNTLAYGTAVMNSYLWNSKFTFQAKKNTRQFIAFIIQSLISLLIANIIFVAGLWLFDHIHGFPQWLETNIPKLASMYLSALASFFFNKYFVFAKKKEAAAE